MIKFDRNPYMNHPDVQKLVKANLAWNGQKFKWAVKIDQETFEINKKIKPVLLEISKNHCAFCDWYISTDFFHPSIEHFDPKSRSPQKAYQWENLFPSCNRCTELKDDSFDERLLKPDDDQYSFDTYFTVTGDGKIEPALNADESVKIRAEITIDLYKLNVRGDLLSLRKRHFRDYQKLAPITDIDERPFRFLIPLAEKAANPDSIINEFLA